MDRSEVYKIIDGERDYQDSLNPGMEHDGVPTVEAEILMMEEYLKDVRSAWTHEHGGHQKALDLLRKVVSMGIRCFEHHGVPSRVITSLKKDV